MSSSKRSISLKEINALPETNLMSIHEWVNCAYAYLIQNKLSAVEVSVSTRKPNEIFIPSTGEFCHLWDGNLVTVKGDSIKIT